MAKVKIQGHASGTGILTVTAPNTSTDRTITLPDATGTLLNSDGSAASLTAIPAANITGTLPAISGANLTSLPNQKVNPNLIINGAMNVAQRGTSSTTEGFSTVDRFRTQMDGEDQLVITQSQSTTAPTGFSHSFKLQSTTAETAWAADETAHFKYYTEAQDMKHLNYGTSDAQSITLSFWVRSSLTGTYAIQIYSQDGDRCIGTTYAISSANTWEKKSMTFAGDTGGTINNDTGRGLQISWYLGAGTDAKSTDNTSWAADVTAKQAYGHTADWGTSTSHDYHITGVKLEVGSTATDFQHRNYGEELALCERYYQLGQERYWGYAQSGTGNRNFQMFHNRMRAAPTQVDTQTASSNLAAGNSDDAFPDGFTTYIRGNSTNVHTRWYANITFDSEL